MARILRVMSPNGNQPAVGRSARCLGVRVPPSSQADVMPDAAGTVCPGGGGMSVVPRFEDLPIHRVPTRFRQIAPEARGYESDRIWGNGAGPFAPAQITDHLRLRPDEKRSGHGFVEPSLKMPLQTYENALAATAPDWSIDEPRIV